MLEETTDARISTPVVADVPPVSVDPELRDGPPLVETDLLIEDVSIDGMCGVY